MSDGHIDRWLNHLEDRCTTCAAACKLGLDVDPETFAGALCSLGRRYWRAAVREANGDHGGTQP